ncbi:hypothetical protein [Desulfoluna spongiiphila]|uniref:Uncharacterized protein n=1 Tax=Desulfoluna spongiiphila TaxID=419481 RepID=A0A1G5CSX1_9BACT|nr:hypothetical protein [Desulfoluna spongiiphila]SCY05358.1 hypothetical protein SAMN05216233_103183 [Desulfoluna spongiiphila]VVS92383.1 hypothetical protein DBB_19510 [Desulfoluna spongiiphila]
MEKNVSKEQWVAMFQEIGLSEEQMMAWHQVFETRHPEVHDQFLAWLGMSEADIVDVRNRCR